MSQNVIRTVFKDGSLAENIFVYYDELCDIVMYYESNKFRKHFIKNKCIGVWNINVKTK